MSPGAEVQDLQSRALLLPQGVPARHLAREAHRVQPLEAAHREPGVQDAPRHSEANKGTLTLRISP